MRIKPNYLNSMQPSHDPMTDHELSMIRPRIPSIKKILLVLPMVFMLFSCTGVYSPVYDTTAPEIISVYTSPGTVFAGREFNLIVQTYDSESSVTVTYDMANDGFFTDSNSGVFPASGSKTIAVRAESAGGITVSFYTLSVESVVLDLYLTFTANTTFSTGDFQINYTIQNFGNVPIQLTGNSYVIYNSNHEPINPGDIGINSNTLVYNTYLAVNASTYEVLSGWSMYLVPYYYDISFYYNDGYGNTNTEAYLGGAFNLQ